MSKKKYSERKHEVKYYRAPGPRSKPQKQKKQEEEIPQAGTSSLTLADVMKVKGLLTDPGTYTWTEPTPGVFTHTFTSSGTTGYVEIGGSKLPLTSWSIDMTPRDDLLVYQLDEELNIVPIGKPKAIPRNHPELGKLRAYLAERKEKA